MQQERPLKKVSKVTKSKIVDINTGEIQEEEKIIDAYIDKEPDYVKIYLRDIVALNDLPKGLDRVINVLLQTMSYGNMIILNSFIKKKMTEELGYKTVQVLNNNINKLVNAEILFRQGTGTYQVNSRYFGSGHWHDIQGIRLQQVYSAKGRDLKTEITYKNNETL
ncbi:replication/maintenance protein RepL [Bacillus toyonensis]|uniref:Plasmid replication protein RepL domain-containing protein n=1 Tax=Bacillus toyonensis TaxID=155322 RepID=A0A2C4QUL8_9BACI|nr:replication/maintenance protein RepL [Bacillus toyonensis]PHD68088.1 hypothetical protein COF40_18395 [Bacillus toyonensis]